MLILRQDYELLRQAYEQAKKRLDNNYAYFKPQEYLRSQLKSPFMRLFAKLRSVGINSSAEHNWHDRSTVKFVENINHGKYNFARYIKDLDQMPYYQLVFLADNGYFDEYRNSEAAKFSHDCQLVVQYEMAETRDKRKNEKVHKQYVNAINKNRDRRRRVGRRIR